MVAVGEVDAYSAHHGKASSRRGRCPDRGSSADAPSTSSWPLVSALAPGAAARASAWSVRLYSSVAAQRLEAAAGDVAWIVMSVAPSRRRGGQEDLVAEDQVVVLVAVDHVVAGAADDDVAAVTCRRSCRRRRSGSSRDSISRTDDEQSSSGSSAAAASGRFGSATCWMIAPWSPKMMSSYADCGPHVPTVPGAVAVDQVAAGVHQVVGDRRRVRARSSCRC